MEEGKDRSAVQKEVTDQYSLRGRVFHRIREDILSGKYSENEELKEATIGAECGVSRTPVREALRQLELEGLVKIVPNKGAYVTGISPKDTRDIYVIRSYLEGLAARWACEHISESEIDTIEEIVYLSEFHAKKKHYEQLVELDNKFHESIYRASGSKILEHELTTFHQYLERIRKESLKKEERALQSNEEHLAILEAIRRRDGDLAEKLAHEHIIQTIENMNKEGLQK
ncbi:MAG: GntR family transcriptional regulator [Lachnospiraceae bacterium]|nr:GntR family transcriptional regulator [Lachnospiraceae bacterium]MBQ8632206.1 GntR family transcriptional regulator [Lachnospiraceae bacterium]